MINWVIGSLVIGLFIGYLLKKWHIKLEIKHYIVQLEKIADLELIESQLTVYNSQSDITPLIIEINQVLEIQRNIIRKQNYNEKQLLEDMANISHDLRTPLTAIYGYLELLNNPSLSEKKRQTYLNIILQRTELLQHLIQDLFYLTKLQTHSITFEFEEISITQVLKEMLVSYYEPFLSHEMDLKVDIQDEYVIEADQSAVERIFTNLIENMFSHGQDSARISLSNNASGRILVRFENQIDNHTKETLDLEQIFNRHYMANSSREQANSGLGLTICKELVEQLGFHLSATIDNEKFIIDLSFSNNS